MNVRLWCHDRGAGDEPREQLVAPERVRPCEYKFRSAALQLAWCMPFRWLVWRWLVGLGACLRGTWYGASRTGLEAVWLRWLAAAPSGSVALDTARAGDLALDSARLVMAMRRLSLPLTRAPVTLICAVRAELSPAPYVELGHRGRRAWSRTSAACGSWHVALLTLAELGSARGGMQYGAVAGWRWFSSCVLDRWRHDVRRLWRQ